MKEQEMRQSGEGRDNLTDAAGQMAKNAAQWSAETTKTAGQAAEAALKAGETAAAAGLVGVELEHMRA